jgi:hypothetical protein
MATCGIDWFINCFDAIENWLINLMISLFTLTTIEALGGGDSDAQKKQGIIIVIVTMIAAIIIWHHSSSNRRSWL